MRIFTNLLFKVTLSSMIVTAPAMINGSTNDAGFGASGKEHTRSYYSSAVIRKFIDHSTLTPAPLFSEDGANMARRPFVEDGINRALPEESYEAERMGTGNTTQHPGPVMLSASAKIEGEEGASSESGNFSESRNAEVKMVISEAVMIYADMSLENTGLDEKAFEYAWRGYHNLLKKNMIRKKSVLSICDFSQSSCSKRMYVIDVRHRKLLYRTYVAHGQMSGEEYASSFSNEPDSYKSSLGFYITKRTYYGRNGLSLRIDGVDTGYNDMAGKRNIVLHGSSYTTDKYLANYGTLGTSLGCPAIPSAISPRIIRAVKNGSCIFIYHPTTAYLENSTIINGNKG
jgi:L,D-transpeptidase catalytic domain